MRPVLAAGVAAVAAVATLTVVATAQAGSVHDDPAALGHIAAAQAELSAAVDDLTAPPPTVTETATVTPSPVTVTATAPTVTVTATPDQAALTGWGSPVWADEFNGATVNAANWTVADGATANGMLERRMAANVTQSNGQLVLTAKKETSGTKSYTSGYVDTAGKPHATGPGTLTLIRASFPTDQDVGKGMWSALWFRSDQGPGEIDLVEAYSNKPDLASSWQKVVITMHSDTAGGAGNTKKSFVYTFPAGTSPQQMHTYGVEILSDRYRFTIDGVQVWEVTTANVPAYASMIDDTWRTIVNQQISAASTYFYAPDAGTVFPRQMAVDFVRVYRKP